MAGLREEVEDALKRLIRIGRMKSAKTQMPGVGEGNGGLHDLRIADLANQDHIRGLAHSVL